MGAGEERIGQRPGRVAGPRHPLTDPGAPDAEAGVRNIVVIGGSAGGVQAVGRLVAALPADFPAAVFVVVHVAAISKSRLPEILGRQGHLPAGHASDGEAIVPGRIYVAPPDLHLLLERDTMRLWHGPRENSCRPSIDVLFRSAADTYGSRVAGVILSGSLDDGSQGLLAIKRKGGLTLVQDPQEASYPEMPRNAIRLAGPDRVGGLADLAALLAASAEDGTHRLDPDRDQLPPPTVEGADSTIDPLCPQCGSALHEVRDSRGLLRCQAGHVYSLESLYAHHGESLQQALQASLDALRQEARLARQVADQARRQGQSIAAERYRQRQLASERHAVALAKLLDERVRTANM